MLIDELHASSVDMQRLTSELIRHFRDIMIIKTVKSEKLPIVCSKKRLSELTVQAEKFDVREVIAILNILQNARAEIQSDGGRTSVEMALIRLCNPEIRLDAASLELRIAALESKINNLRAAPAAARQPESAENGSAVSADVSEQPPEILGSDAPPADEYPQDYGPETAIADAAAEPAENTAAFETAANTADTADERPLPEWEDILAVLQTTCPIIAGVLGDSKAYIYGDRLLIDTENSQFRSLYGGKSTVYRESIRKAAEKILGKTYKLGPYKKHEPEKVGDPLAAFADKLKDLEN